MWFYKNKAMLIVYAILCTKSVLRAETTPWLNPAPIAQAEVSWRPDSLMQGRPGEGGD